jgi:catechol 2,3-dioxygenase-like lactoylglutathione lyase family enzyme
MSRPPLVPELYVLDLRKSLHFYVDLLGFRIEYQRPESAFAALSLAGAHLMLEQTPACEAATDDEFAQGQWRTAHLVYPFGRGINLEITVADVQAIYARLLTQAYPITLALQEKWYRVNDCLRGVRQFLVMDPDGYLIRMAQTIAERRAGEVGE